MTTRPLSEEEIALAFELVLDRRPPPDRLAALVARGTTLGQLRGMLLQSDEFLRQALRDSCQPERLPDRLPERLSGPLGRLRRVMAGAPPAPPLRIDRAATTVVHLHIPKSAGTSLNIQLMGHYPEFARIDARAGSPHQQLAQMSRDKRACIGLVAGHCVHGLHRLLPRPVLYLAVLRRPGPRLLSFHRYILRTATHPMHATVTRLAPGFGTFLELAQENAALRIEVDNGQLRRISGEMTAPQVDTALLDTARRHLLADNMVHGVVERLDPFLHRLVLRGVIDQARDVRANVDPRNTTGNNRVDSPPDNSPAPAPDAAFETERKRLSAAQADLLDRFTHWDAQLYTLAARHRPDEPPPEEKTA
ncbi:MAG: hypothetical protein HWD84_11505 [Flavobacteriaceae bacterium]|nr:hypothetical protein [Flavobacteriaceae bacterium]